MSLGNQLKKTMLWVVLSKELRSLSSFTTLFRLSPSHRTLTNSFISWIWSIRKELTSNLGARRMAQVWLLHCSGVYMLFRHRVSLLHTYLEYEIFGSRIQLQVVFKNYVKVYTYLSVPLILLLRSRKLSSKSVEMSKGFTIMGSTNRDQCTSWMFSVHLCLA